MFLPSTHRNGPQAVPLQHLRGGMGPCDSFASPSISHDRDYQTVWTHNTNRSIGDYTTILAKSTHSLFCSCPPPPPPVPAPAFCELCVIVSFILRQISSTKLINNKSLEKEKKTKRDAHNFNMMTSEQRSESVVDKHQQHSSLTEDSNSNASSASLNSRSGGSSPSDNSSVDIENGGSVGDAPINVDLSDSITAAVPAVIMSVADSLSPVKAAVHHQPHEASGSSATASHTSKLSLNHQVSHLYTIEAILGLNNQHSKGAVCFYEIRLSIVAYYRYGVE